jgi:excinuclease ABC subunit B
VALVAILDADKEGFLRSATSLIQTAGRAARHEKGRVLLYADTMTRSLKKAIDVTHERRERQSAYNETHGITPKSVQRAIQSSLHYGKKETADPVSVKEAGGDENIATIIAELEEEMLSAANDLEFERAAVLRDQIDALRNPELTGQRKRHKTRQRKTRR